MGPFWRLFVMYYWNSLHILLSSFMVLISHESILCTQCRIKMFRGLRKSVRQIYIKFHFFIIARQIMEKNSQLKITFNNIMGNKLNSDIFAGLGFACLVCLYNNLAMYVLIVKAYINMQLYKCNTFTFYL